MAKPYINLKKPKNTASGVADYILVAHEDDFEDGGIKCPEAPVDGDPMGLGVKITADHEFKVGRGFAKMNAAPEKNQFTGKTIGDTGFNKFDFEAPFFFAGTYEELHEQVANFMNQPLIVLFKDANCEANIWYQLGCDCTKCYATPEWGTGTTKDGVKGYNVTFKWQNAYVQLYATANGPLILED